MTRWDDTFQPFLWGYGFLSTNITAMTWTITGPWFYIRSDLIPGVCYQVLHPFRAPKLLRWEEAGCFFSITSLSNWFGWFINQLLLGDGKKNDPCWDLDAPIMEMESHSDGHDY